MEMLGNAIKKYRNKILAAAEVMEELIKISREIALPMMRPGRRA